MLCAIRLWALTQGMEEIVDKQNISSVELSFKKGDEIYGFVTEFDCDIIELKDKISQASPYYQNIYVITDDT